jgi:MerR family transcriptional regulator, thiopeptide resistance regulator
MSDVIDFIPVIVCSDIEAEHGFLVEVLGFDSAGLDRSPDGVAQHGEVTAGDHRIWLHRAADEHKLASPKALVGADGGVVVQVRNVDAHHARVAALVSARAGGITSEPTDQEYGVRDPEGHNWWFATPTAPPAAR